jgi:hypothetical protein
MKIEPELRKAITSAYKSQPETGWRETEEAEQKSIAALLATKKGSKIIALKKRIDLLTHQLEIARETLSQNYGVHLNERTDTGFDFINYDKEDEGAPQGFLNAGGIAPTMPKPRWNLHNFITDIAAATPQEGKALLKSIGINWE